MQIAYNTLDKMLKKQIFMLLVGSMKKNTSQVDWPIQQTRDVEPMFVQCWSSMKTMGQH